MALARRKEVLTQLNRIVLMASSLPMRGRATLIEEPIKGMRNEPNVVTSKAGLLFLLIL
jgi:hypothetical protein